MELNFCWQRSLHQTEILILHCPIFYSRLTFFQNCCPVFFDLFMQWQSSVSFVLTLTSILSKILIIFSSNWSSVKLSKIMCVCLGCYAFYTDLAQSNKVPTPQFDKVEYFDKVLNFHHGVLQWWTLNKQCSRDNLAAMTTWYKVLSYVMPGYQILVLRCCFACTILSRLS